MTNDLVTVAQMTPANERFCETCNALLTTLNLGCDEEGRTDIARVCTDPHCPMYDQEQQGKLADE